MFHLVLIHNYLIMVLRLIMIKKSMTVMGMSCAMCAKTIENTFDHYEEVSCKVNVSANKVILTYDENRYTWKELADIISSSGYDPVIDDSNSSEKERHRLQIELIISLTFSLPLFWAMFGHLEFFSFVYVPDVLMNPWVQLALASVVQFYVGLRFYKASYHSIRNKVLGMDILVVLGTTTAYLYSLYILISNLIIPMNMMPMVYFEVSAMIITMILIGNYLEHIAKERTTDALTSLVALGAKEARVFREGTEQMIHIDEVELNDVVVVLPHEKIPVDGVIVDGETSVNQSMITGESIPVYKKINDEVIGSTLNQDGKILIKVTKVGSETLLETIIQTVEDNAALKPPIQRVADRVASIFVPGIIAIAILTFIISYIVLGEFIPSFERMIAVIVISCPCALGLATPTSILVGNSLAAQNQILYKGGEFFERANQINAVCFDKTGTLTKGEPVVTNFDVNEDYVNFVLALESMSHHPISKAVQEYLKNNEEGSLVVTNYNVLQGKGIEGTINNNHIIIGSKKAIDVEIDSHYNGLYDKWISEAKTVNFVLVDDVVVGCFAVQDEIKPTAKMVIDEMKTRGITPYMITGDHQNVANEIAKQLGITHVYANVLPSEKSDIVKSLMDEGYVVAFVGDGINDAPALKLADIGVAMGFGTDVAIDSSDVTLMSHDLGLLLNAIDLSKSTLRNIYQNFIWAFSYNIIAIPLAASGRLSMILAAAAMAFSSLTVVLNALRLKRFKFVEYKTKRGEMMTFNVPDMSCGHCKAKIEKSLAENNIKDFNVVLETQTVEASDDNQKELVTKAIVDAGYTIE
jgi:Cu+-exporting ATPase